MSTKPNSNRCPCGGYARQRDCPKCKLLVAPPSQIEADRQLAKMATRATGAEEKYKTALRAIERLEREQDAVLALQDVEPCVIQPKHGSGTSEAVIVAPASDWHLEERVDPRTVSGLNESNLEIADRRVTKYFQGVLRLTRLLQQDVKIDTMLMPLLGDFISGDIHEEVAEVCLIPPMEAVVFAQDRLTGGIEFLLEHTKLNLRFNCHSGNHARTTKTTRFATENGHSLEYLMYRHLAAYFRNEKRVQFEIAEGPHSYAEVFGVKLRLQHGHMVKYNGGVGGIYIPVNKAIAQWNKGRTVDLDIFGHFHQLRDGGNFVCNGSLIGFNSFALSIKADYEPPKQALMLIDKKRGRTCTWPLIFEERK
jgi:hypothetical protein